MRFPAQRPNLVVTLLRAVSDDFLCFFCCDVFGSDLSLETSALWRFKKLAVSLHRFYRLTLDSTHFFFDVESPVHADELLEIFDPIF